MRNRGVAAARGVAQTGIANPVQKIIGFQDWHIRSYLPMQ
jgi:hypothetical protein